MVGNTKKANSPSHKSVLMSQAPAATSRTKIDVEKGNGANSAIAASVSVPARAATSPVMRARCHAGGWVIMCRSTLSAIVLAVVHSNMPANDRRTTTPAARTTPIATTISEAPSQVPKPTDPVVPGSKLGKITSSIINFTPYDDATVAMANTAAPLTAITK